MNKDSTVAQDFSLKLPALAVKELRQGLRMRGFILILTAASILFSLLFITGFVLETNSFYISALAHFDISSIFWGIVAFIFLLVIPLRLAGSINHETSTRKADLLLLTKLTPWKIVWGKWLSAMLQASLIACSLFPFFILRYYYGGVDLANDFYIFIIFILASGLFSSITLWLSGTHIIFRILVLLTGGSFFLYAIIASIVAYSLTGSYFSIFGYSSFNFAIASLVAYDLAIAILIFITLASKHLSPPAANVSIRLRYALLGTFIPNFILFPFILNNIYAQRMFNSQMSFSLTMASILIILELTGNSKLLPAHCVELKQQRFASLKQFFLAPGFFSTSMFMFLFAIISFCISAIFSKLTTPESFPQNIILIASIVMAWCYSVHAPAFLLAPFRNKLNDFNTLVYFILSGLLIVFSLVIFQGIDHPGITFTPYLNFFVFVNMEAKNSSGILIFLSILMALGFVLMWSHSAEWLSAKKKADNLLPTEQA